MRADIVYFNRLALGPAILFGLALLAGGCSDPWTDGRFWRQPVEAPPRLRPMSIGVGRAGGTSESGVGPGFAVSDGWPEAAGVEVGVRGTAADSGRYRERAATTGDVRDNRRYGAYREGGGASTGSAGSTANTGSYPETGRRSGVGG